MEVVLHPEVFANGQPQAPGAAAPLKLEHGRLLAGPEIAALIKDVVTGQQAFAAHHPPAGWFDQGDGVVEAGPTRLEGGFGDSHQKTEASGHCRCQPLQHQRLLFDQGRLQQQVPGRVAPER